ncbi:MAG: hypothetical protein GEU95_13320 [Rhizobiales bacterium]|nr:hypothetical protein [Hyphomicrobiales bacterium]
MTIKTKLILSAALVALLSAPASARIDGDEGGASAFPRFTKERTHMTGSGFVSPSGHFINRPFHQR